MPEVVWLQAAVAFTGTAVALAPDDTATIVTDTQTFTRLLHAWSGEGDADGFFTVLIGGLTQYERSTSATERGFDADHGLSPLLIPASAAVAITVTNRGLAAADFRAGLLVV